MAMLISIARSYDQIEQGYTQIRQMNTDKISLLGSVIVRSIRVNPCSTFTLPSLYTTVSDRPHESRPIHTAVGPRCYRSLYPAWQPPCHALAARAARRAASLGPGPYRA